MTVTKWEIEPERGRKNPLTISGLVMRLYQNKIVQPRGVDRLIDNLFKYKFMGLDGDFLITLGLGDGLIKAINKIVPELLASQSVRKVQDLSQEYVLFIIEYCVFIGI